MTKLQVRVASAVLLVLATGVYLSRWPDTASVVLAAVTSVPAVLWIGLTVSSIRDRRRTTRRTAAPDDKQDG